MECRFHTTSCVSRCELFNKAYNHISECIDQVYKELTKGKASPMGGVAYLSLEDSEVTCKLQIIHTTSLLTVQQEHYAGGLKYHAMPPMKRFRDMEQLSGGEKTVAALALLFAIHRSVKHWGKHLLIYASSRFLCPVINRPRSSYWTKWMLP